jgi:hypothetical protein
MSSRSRALEHARFLEGASLALPERMKRTPETEWAHGIHANRPKRPDDGRAFLPDSVGEHDEPFPGEAESDAEEFISSALNGESVGEDARDEVGDDEDGGPFIVLDEDGRLPPEPAEAAGEGAVDRPERETEPEPVSREQILRGGRWAARGV